MKPAIIRINDVSDIDTAKISVYDLNNRYVDKNGNMYGVKYNSTTRKVEIIRIIRAVEREVVSMQQRIYKKKSSGFETPFIAEEEPKAKPAVPSDTKDEFANFEPELFINDGLKFLLTHKERIKGIIMNLRNSNVFPRENKQENIELETVFRNLEIDGELGFDHVENYQKELQNYPRSINYYQAKIDDRGNRIIEGMGGDKERIMKFVYLYEMYTSLNTLYKNLFSVLHELRTIVDEKNVDEMKTITHNDKQYFYDAKTSTNNTIEEIEEIVDKLKIMERYIHEPDNF